MSWEIKAIQNSAPLHKTFLCIPPVLLGVKYVTISLYPWGDLIYLLHCNHRQQ